MDMRWDVYDFERDENWVSRRWETLDEMNMKRTDKGI